MKKQVVVPLDIVLPLPRLYRRAWPRPAAVFHSKELTLLSEIRANMCEQECAHTSSSSHDEGCAAISHAVHVLQPLEICFT